MRQIEFIAGFGYELNMNYDEEKTLVSSNSHVYTLPWDVGAHTSFAGKICDTLWTSINYGMYATQFFLGNPYSYNRADISAWDLDQCQKIRKKYPLKIFSHFPYIANLAGSTKILAWSGNSTQDSKTTSVLKSLEYELSVLGQLDGGVVIHPGNYKDRQTGLKTIAKSINKINFSPQSKLILENSAGQGDSLATTFQEIKTIIDGIEPKKRKHIGVCIDTCHLYTYGDYDLSDCDQIDKMFLDFDDILGSDRFTLLHLNDSQACMKKCVDRHACLGTGCIWEKNFDSLIHLLNICQQRDIPIILETHGMDMITLAILGHE